MRRYIAQCALKNVELAQVVNSSIDLGGAFFSWIFTMVTLIHGVENFDVASVEATQQQWCGDEDKILKVPGDRNSKCSLILAIRNSFYEKMQFLF